MNNNNGNGNYSDNGNGHHGNSNNGNNNENSNNENGKSDSSIPSAISIEQLEELAKKASQPSSEIQPKPPNLLENYQTCTLRRDKIIDDWEIKSRKESRRLLHEFADKFIEAIIASDSNYTMLQRLLSDLQQERKKVYAYGQAIANINAEYNTAKQHLRKYERGW